MFNTCTSGSGSSQPRVPGENVIVNVYDIAPIKDANDWIYWSGPSRYML